MNNENSPYQAPSTQIDRTSMVYCRACGKQIPSTARSCPYCNKSQNMGEGKSKVAAALLALFLGGFGVHRFYLGQWWGLFYLLFFWTGIPGLIAFIEFIVFLATSQHSWDEKYGDKKGGSALLLVLIFVFVPIPVIGILAAIAIPAYHDYTVRAKTAEMLMAAREPKAAVAEYWYQNNDFPDSEEELGYDFSPASDFVLDIDLRQDGVIVIEAGKALGDQNYGKTIEFRPVPSHDGGSLTWDCSGGSYDQKYRPAACRKAYR